MGPVYSAFYSDDHRQIIYRYRRNEGNLIPPGSVPIDDRRSTYWRQDGGDPFQWALFREVASGRQIVVQRFDNVPAEKVVHGS